MMCLACVSACGFSPVGIADARPDTAKPIDGPPDMSPMTPMSCKDVHTANPGLPSGPYTIEVGSTQVQVNCDMTTEGGGWTIVFFANSDDQMGSLAYLPGVAPLLSTSTDVLLAYRNATLAVQASYATLPMPLPWRTDPPFNAPGNDVSLPVSINGALPATSIVRFGYGSFNADCADPWFGGTRWGRVCIVGTTAPFYNGFALAGDDQCSGSNGIWNATPCSTGRRFSIAVR